MLSEKQKINIRTVIYITIGWIIFLVLIFSYEVFSFKIRDYEFYKTNDFSVEFFTNLLAGILAGIMGGSLLVFGIRSRTRKQPFYYGILTTAIYFIIIYLMISFLTSIIFLTIARDLPFYHPQVLHETVDNLTQTYQIRNFTMWTFIVIITQFILQVNDKFGPGNLWKVIIGKYYKPREELRVFMFLDLKSSTGIAEKLGHQRYYHFLNDFYAVISDPLLNHKAEIYQYVGDEIVVSWTIRHAVENKNCLYCFFEIGKKVKEKKDTFLNKYDIEPQFKAGIHFGPVTVGEVGVLKRDIVFTGDVLNTTSRIQSMCNSLKVSLLISDNTLALFDHLEPFSATLIERIELRGREKKINLNSLELKERI